MLTQLYVKDFAIVDNLDIEFNSGMTTITGETGAGKSISIDALGLCLGDRADANMVRHGSDKTEVSARFSISKIPEALNWLKENELAIDTSNDCIIRRIINSEGRSKAYINGTPVPLQQLKLLSTYLVNIHGQHAHQLLLKSENQLSLLDEYAAHSELINSTFNAYQYWSMQKAELSKLKKAEQQRLDRLQLVEYQVAELDDFAIAEGEFEELEAEHKVLSNAVGLVNESQLALTMLFDSDEHSACSLVQSLANKLGNLSSMDESLKPIQVLLSEASINLQEASSELRHYVDGLEPDPERLMQLDLRMTQALDLARKHKTSPEQLFEEHALLSKELHEIQSSNELTLTLENEVDLAEKRYWEHATILHNARYQAAEQLSKAITASMQELNMPQAQFCIEVVQSSSPSKNGSDNIDFLVSANAGQTLQTISKVASGGELSRISLAIQVITAERVSTPTLIFDEVDVGISGATAAIVGKMLRRIGENTQVICVTHLPQVAACGHNQMQVHKNMDEYQTHTSMRALEGDARIEELARLLGGDKITQTAIANAKELLTV